LTGETDLAVEVRGLDKSFGARRALTGIEFEAKAGECLAVLGLNGAGKTTLIRVLATLSRPSAGTIRLAGLDITREATGVRRKIGVVGHQPFLYDNLTAEENLRFYGRMYDVPDLGNRITEIVSGVGLSARLHDRTGILSRGTRQRFAIARALLHDPPILLLDEPETGLDRQASTMLNELIKSLITGHHTVIMTTHDLEQVLELADRVIILHRGRVRHDGPTRGMDLASLQEHYRTLTGAAS